MRSFRLHSFPTALLGLICSLLVFSCQEGTQSKLPATTFRLAVFVPGVVAGSPTYEMMVEGVEAAKVVAASEGRTLEYKVVEAGYQQNEWFQSLSALAADSNWDLIVSSNPSLPDLAKEALKTFPAARFLILDAYDQGSPGIKTIGFDQYQQGYLNGYLAGLIGQEFSTQAPTKVGLLAGQEYPVMDQQIKPGFLEGAQAAAGNIDLEYRVLGNWYDAARAEELAKSMYDQGAKVVLAIAGGGNQGVVQAARQRNGYVTWFDSPGYGFGPDVVKGGTVVLQADFCKYAVLQAMAGTLDFGLPQVFGVADGAVSYAFGPEADAAWGPRIKAALEAKLREMGGNSTTQAKP